MDKRAEMLLKPISESSSFEDLKKICNVKSDIEVLQFLCEIMEDNQQALYESKYSNNVCDIFQKCLTYFKQEDNQNLGGIARVNRRLERMSKYANHNLERNQGLTMPQKNNIMKVNGYLSDTIGFLCNYNLNLEKLKTEKESLIRLRDQIKDKKINDLSNNQKKMILKIWNQIEEQEDRQLVKDLENKVDFFLKNPPKIVVKKSIDNFLFNNENNIKNSKLDTLINPYIFTIDTEGAYILEDALMVEQLENSFSRLHIFISDPFAYRDKEYREVFEKNNVSQRSNGKYSYSLAKDKIRPAIHFALEFDENNKWIDETLVVSRSLIKVKESYSFLQANQILASQNTDIKTQTLKKCYQLYKSIETLLPNETRYQKMAKKYFGYGDGKSSKMCEKIMNILNYAVILELYKNDLPAIYRRKDIAETDNKILDSCKETSSFEQIKIIKEEMPESYYSKEPGPHDGLGLPIYTNITRPLREDVSKLMLAIVKDFLIDKKINEDLMKSYEIEIDRVINGYKAKAKIKDMYKRGR